MKHGVAHHHVAPPQSGWQGKIAGHIGSKVESRRKG
jgi:hypothetical protein